jgi:hypothetical protein
MNLRTDRFHRLVMIVLLASASSAVSQIQNEPDKEARVRNTLAGLLAGVGVETGTTLPSADTQTHTQIRVRWQSSVALNSPDANKLERRPSPGVVSLVNSVSRDGVVPRERSLELSANQILVVALDENRGLRWWKLLLDPRVVRSETVAASGEIHGEDLYRPRVEFTVECPNDRSIRELRFYHPSWTGREFRLESLGALPVR